MKILLTNDDGYRAPGLRALYEALSEVAEVTVVAPEREQSAVSLSITLSNIIRVSRIEDEVLRGFYVEGTPGDCVKYACAMVYGEKPDYVFSGINHGSNVGLNANYSGTVAGAVEGTMLGIPSVAVSLASFNSDDFSAAANAAREVLEMIQRHPLGKYELLNVNVPPLPWERIKGMKVTRASLSSFRERFEKRVDYRNRDYYWIGGEWEELESVEQGDREANDEGYIAITPLTVDWTAHSALERMRSRGWDREWNRKDG